MSTDLLAAATEQFPQTVPGPASGDPRTSATVRNMGSPLANGALWLRRRLEEVVGAFLPLGGLFPVAASVGSSTFTINGHGLSNNDPVNVQSIGGNIPTPLTLGTTYYVVNSTTNTFKVSATVAGGAITLTDNGTGTIYVAKRSVWTTHNLTIDTLNTAVLANLGGLLSVAGGFVTLANSATFFVTGLIQRSGTDARYQERPTVLMNDTAGVDATIDTSMGDNFTVAQPTAQRIIFLREVTSPTPLEGETITISRGSSGAFSVLVKREGQSAAVVTLPGSTRSAATIKFIDLNDGAGVRYRLISTFAGTAGADA